MPREQAGLTDLTVEPLDRGGSIPLYLQLATVLPGKTERGEWQPDQKIPSENDLNRMYGISRMTARQAGLEPQFAALLPELVIEITPEQLAMVAARALTPKAPPTVGLDHLHVPQVSVREQAALVVDRLRRSGTMTFRALCGDSPDKLTTVARFLSLLELFREGAVGFDQVTPLGELTIRWTGAEEGEVDINDEFDGAEPDDGGVVPDDRVEDLGVSPPEGPVLPQEESP